MKKYYFGFFLLLFTTYIPIKAQDTLYFNNDGIKCEKVYAGMYKICISDKDGYIIKVYNLKGDLLHSGTSMVKIDLETDGPFVSLFDNGQVKDKGYFLKKIKTGEWKIYAESGLLLAKRRFSSDGEVEYQTFYSYFENGMLQYSLSYKGVIFDSAKKYEYTDAIRYSEQQGFYKSEEVISNSSDIQRPITIVEETAEFPGGEEGLFKYLSENMKYPAESRGTNRQGTCYASFVVEPDGTITNVQIIRGVDIYLDFEVMRVVENMPKWSPGKMNGKPVRQLYNMPLRISFN